VPVGVIDVLVYPSQCVYPFQRTVLAQLGESESLGRWSDSIEPEEANFEALRRLSRLYMVTVIDFLEDRFGAGAINIKMLAFPDFVFKLEDSR
jgi:hypothetical protein